MKFTEKQIKCDQLLEKITALESELEEIGDYESEEYQTLDAELQVIQDEYDELAD
jgi:hypothetical protein